MTINLNLIRHILMLWRVCGHEVVLGIYKRKRGLMTRVYLSSRYNNIITSNNSILGLVSFLSLSELGQKSILMRIRGESIIFLLIAEQKP